MSHVDPVTPSPRPLVTGSQLAGPAPPQPTRSYGSSAALLAILATVLVFQFVRSLDLGGFTEVLLGLVLPAALLLAPVAIAWWLGTVSTQKWGEGEHVAARELAADSRAMAVSSIGVSVFVALIAGGGALVLANDGAVAKTFFNVEYMTAAAVDIVKALGINIQIAVGAQVAAMVFGLLLALGRLLPGRGFGPIRVLSIAYIDAFRGIPSVILIYLVCYGLPLTGVPILSEGPLVLYAIVALTLTYSAYNAELFRAGIESVNTGQTQAALSMGLTPMDVNRFVILPQALRNVAAPMLSQFIGLQKDTALVIVVGIIDAFSQAKIYSANDFNLSAVTAVAIIFVLITLPQTRLVDWILARTGSQKGRTR